MKFLTGSFGTIRGTVPIMERLAVIGLVVFLATGAFGQDACSSSPCTGNDICHIRNSAEGYVCQCTLPNRSGFDCSTPAENQEVFTCYGSDCRTGVFRSNSYPNNYPNRYRALYLIYVPGGNGFTFTFDTPFAIETSKDELYVGAGLIVDFAAIQAGQVNENGDIFFFEGDTVPNSFTVTGTDVIWMYFLTDKNIPQTGFQVRWVVVDNSPPVITGCPSNLVLTATNLNGDTVTWTPPQAVDVNTFTTSSTHTPEQFFSLGTTQVTYTFTDSLFQTSTCSFSVTLSFVDVIAPVVTCPDNLAFDVPFGSPGRRVTYSLPTVTDNSNEFFLVSSTNNPNDLFQVGSTTVTYTYRDGSNNRNPDSDQSGVEDAFTTHLQFLFGTTNHLVNYVGKRANILFEGAAAAFYHLDHMVHFVSHLSRAQSASTRCHGRCS